MTAPLDKELRARRMAALFDGLARAHMRAKLSGQRSAGKGKLEVHYDTLRRGVSLEDWGDHLDGKIGLTIIPIRDDSTVVFGAIDIDVYDLNIGELERRVEQAGFPLVTTRTKSGGAHLYLFADGPLPAVLVRGKLMEWAVALGFPHVEIYPKQVQLADDKDTGSGINVPYPAGDKSLRYAVRGGKALSVDEFLDFAEGRRATEGDLQAVVVRQEEDLKEAPPCLQCLAKTMVSEGGRNSGLFNFAVYAKKRWPDAWEPRVEEFNRRYIDPPLGSDEVSALLKSARRKDYSYSCDQPPIRGVCNRQICLTREFGVAGADDDPGVTFGSLTKVMSDPPSWIWDVDGYRVKLDAEDLQSQRKFQLRCMAAVDKMPYPMKPKSWLKLVNEKMAAVERVEVPVDATQDGQVWEALQDFVLRAPARSKEEVLNGRAFMEDGLAYFRSKDLFRYLEQQRYRGHTPNGVWTMLRDRGAKHKFWNMKGNGFNIWAVPIDVKTVELTVPEVGGSEF